MMARLVLLAAVTCALLAGCQKSNKFVGSWQAEQQGLTNNIDFKADGTMVMEMDIPQIQNVHVHVEGTWRSEGDKLYMTPKDAKSSNLPQEAKGHEAEFDKGVAEGMKVGVERVNTVKWTGDKSFTATNPDNQQVTTYTKKQS